LTINLLALSFVQLFGGKQLSPNGPFLLPSSSARPYDQKEPTAMLCSGSVEDLLQEMLYLKPLAINDVADVAGFGTSYTYYSLLRQSLSPFSMDVLPL
jgi:hypothetical protein